MIFKDAKKILQDHKMDLTKRGARTLAIFGSTARNEAKTKSDVDILVDFDTRMGLFGFVDLKNYLEIILKCDVDLVTKNALHLALKDKILNEAKSVY